MNQKPEGQGTLQKQFMAACMSYDGVNESDTTMKAFYRGQKELLINLMLMEKAGVWTSANTTPEAPQETKPY